MITMFIDNRKVEARDGETVLDVARRYDIDIPTLCHHEAVEPSGACRLCMVEITMPKWDGWSKLVTACLYPATQDLRVSTMSEDVKKTRAMVLDLLLARCPDSMVLQELGREYGVPSTSFVPRENPDDCILCGLCVRICEKIGRSAITTAGRGHQKLVGAPFEEPPEDCIGCGACAEVCPTDCIAVSTENGIRRIWERDFPMVRCEHCGATFMTEAEREHLQACGELDSSYFTLCESCKREQTAKTFARVVLKTHPNFVPKQTAVPTMPVQPRFVRRRG